MAEVIRMPKMSDTMEEGVIAEWHKKVGDKIKSGEVIAEVETDKATMDLESYWDGTLLYIGVKKGDAVPIDGIMAIVGAEGEDYQSLLDGASNGNGSAPAAASASPAAPAVETVTPQPTPAAAAPAVKPAVSTEKINAAVVRMPKMSDTMEEGTLVSWQKKVGDKVKSGDILAEVETDKATMELEAYEDGTLLYVGIKEGDAVPVDAIIAVIGEEGSNVEALLARENGEAPAETAAAPAPGAAAQASSAPAVNGSEKAVSVADSNERVKASPLAKRLADEKGINLSEVSGSGDNGRIVKRDVDEFKPAAQASAPAAAPAQAAPAAAKAETSPVASAPATGDFVDTPISQMRKTIARRLSESLFTAPHFYVTMEINMDKAMALRPQLNEVATAKISFNDMVIKACAVALKQHPAVNSAWLGDKIRKYNYVNIGVAVAVDEGLLVPVIREADKKTLSAISGEVKDLAGKAKDKKLQPKDWEGNTFSVSNLGMFGVDEFTAIINPPDSCILAIGAIKKVAAFKEDGTVYPTNIMKVTLSADHRVVDGATAAQFLLTVKKLLEEPMSMLV
ncbi:pyruvate dehydrogenase E2 component (dihydrolipoamide acetyltransferase) [Dyadobacter sp. BE34]|uniref:Acetyltransferase component of pyruvate dehydrogenase complex n=1 Tax=Dyadobacter fermentans TaxID=94254 RepID=A0ABU1R6D2_9BACT|nr:MULTISPECIES: pyruvate dehydrogenase complex dihydrolipoamide acetyltransferase [Dyadobacter]MDR6808969.1 pyruvate dehydrogenase E2 component (dihydrolipoamide acetyltransferase) [Dyadobacter fermentans]MDR7046712.1 pyruvate dehydrogenase E2 component (dihydrolipoamide acetyltransferase) [Dyadobacter sp. BE242]MDR7201026.1 pyruvate dehydrogenase E2 component (dihydrolipoamide acetyltransferase) [Dyadobacter sp. BE34]MDR7218986.1 pyruvate dehydrogenase E2 component (dihydrolipoamide acetyltra